MARTYASPTGSALSSGGTISIAIPTPSTYAGKVCFLAITAEQVSTNTFATPSGWNVIKSDRSSTIQALGVFWRVLSGADASTVDFTALNTTGSQAHFGIGWVDDEVDPAGPIDQVSSVLENTATAAVTLTLNGITAGTAKNLYAVYGSSDNASGSSGTGTGRASFTHDSATMVEEIDADTDAGGDVALGISFQANVTGATGNKTVVGTPASTTNYRVVGILFSVNLVPSSTPKSGTDTGSGSEGTSIVDVSVTDSGSGAEGTSTVSTVSDKTGTDTASGTEATPIVGVTGTDTFTGEEVNSLVDIDDGLTEGTGTETSSLTTIEASTESGTLTETSSPDVPTSVTDENAAITETAEVELPVSATDSSSVITETSDEVTFITSTDSASGSESIIESSLSVDAVDNNDSVSESTVLDEAYEFTSNDSASGDEDLSIDSTYSSDDTSSGNDSGLLGAEYSGIDSSDTVDESAEAELTQLDLSVTEAASGEDSIVIEVSNSVIDAALYDDTILLSVDTTTSDNASDTEVTLLEADQEKLATDSASGVDNSSVDISSFDSSDFNDVSSPPEVFISVVQDGNTNEQVGLTVVLVTVVDSNIVVFEIGNAHELWLGFPDVDYPLYLVLEDTTTYLVIEPNLESGLYIEDADSYIKIESVNTELVLDNDGKTQLYITPIEDTSVYVEPNDSFISIDDKPTYISIEEYHPPEDE